MKDFSAKLTKLLEEKKISQKALANSVGMSPTGFSQMLGNGSMKMKIYEQICDTLEVPYSYFYDEGEEHPSTLNEESETKISIMQNVIDDLLNEIKSLKMKVYTRENQLRQNNVNFHSVSKCGGVLAA